MQIKNQYKNNQVLEDINFSLLNSILNKIEILESNGETVVKLSFILNSKLRVMIEFIDVMEYSFYHNSSHIFYNVESYKFFMNNENKFYISLDPVSENEIIEKDDNDFIIARAITLNTE